MPTFTTQQIIVLAVIAFFGVFMAISEFVYRKRKLLVEATDSQWLRKAPLANVDADEQPVDPWLLQHVLMLASDQQVPKTPTVTRTTLLYFAMILEEAAELAVALEETLRLASATGRISRVIGMVSKDMDDSSKQIRALLAGIGEYDINIIPPFATRKLLLDGTTDIAVVNSGFALAAGFRGDIAYSRVQTSNLSKRNPDTGKIDKDPSGKWIKGRAYQMPYLEDLIG